MLLYFILIDFLSISKVIIFSVIATDDRHPNGHVLYTKMLCYVWQFVSAILRNREGGGGGGGGIPWSWKVLIPEKLCLVCTPMSSFTRQILPTLLRLSRNNNVHNN